ncbi:putative glycoside hydrolase [Psychrilyobacter sp.]|uniref:putative glycoside hydrolase n=1 Tax=Psychrilyobacter sp. TaxID=2586924 RepID=UPI003016ECEA
MRKIKTIIFSSILIVAIFFIFKIKDNLCLKKETIIQKEVTSPSTMYISELTTLRESIDGKPKNSLIIGTLVNILKVDKNWVYVSTNDSNYKGWAEQKYLTEVKLEDQDIFQTIKVLTDIPVDNDGNEVKDLDQNNSNQKFIKKIVNTNFDIKELYQLGDVQFKSINKQLYKNNPKKDIKAIYISLNGMYHVDDYIDMAKKTNINAFVLDIKNDRGRILFESPTARKNLGDSYIRPRIKNIETFIKKLKKNNIYLIGRISTFKDESYAVSNKNDIILDKRYNRAYQDSDKISWLSPYNRNTWYYNIELAKEAADFGFNEILFDYVRFPDRVQNLEKNSKLVYNNSYSETKPEVIQRFLKYAHDELAKKEVYIAASVFGQIGISKNDENIGQHWESISNIVDFINPMAYPSHYAEGTYGLKSPDNNPFTLLNYYTKDVILRNNNLENPAIIEPWIQGFSAPWIKNYRSYKTEELKEQIKALRVEGLHSYLVWNASSRYYWDGLK